jgi:hypothetical protein
LAGGETGVINGFEGGVAILSSLGSGSMVKENSRAAVWKSRSFPWLVVAAKRFKAMGKV